MLQISAIESIVCAAKDLLKMVDKLNQDISFIKAK